nr:ATP-dependent DNA helicase PIF1-like [Tanacetum cinerariifolium]
MVGSIRKAAKGFHYILYAKIHKIHREHGWAYLAYKKCGRIAKQAEDGTKLWNCTVHKGIKEIGVGMRYKVIIHVIDDTGLASLLLFDDLVFQLTNGVRGDSQVRRSCIFQRQDVVHTSLNMSYLWNECTISKLTKNMRLRVGCNPEDAEEINDFADWILNIGEGKIGGKSDDVDIGFNFNESLYTIEFLNTIKMSGIPHHKLVLKVGAPVRCLRNIDQRGRLCNGSIVAIPRMNISPSDKKMPFQLNRRQFSVAVSFAMTINKSQGQTLSKVRLFLERSVFSHGQLYVAVSRVKSKKGLKVLCCDKDGNFLYIVILCYDDQSSITPRVSALVEIMPPRMTTRRTSRSTVAPRGGRTGRRTCSGCRRTGDQDGQGGDRGNEANEGVDKVLNFSMVIAQQMQNLLPTIIAQVGNHANNIQGDVRNVSASNGQSGCSYKEFLACNQKDYDGQGGVTVYTRWIEKTESF